MISLGAFAVAVGLGAMLADHLLAPKKRPLPIAIPSRGAASAIPEVRP